MNKKRKNDRPADCAQANVQALGRAPRLSPGAQILLHLLKQPVRDHAPRDELEERLRQMRKRHVITRERAEEVARRCRVINDHDARHGGTRYPALTEGRLEERIRMLQRCYADLWRVGNKIEVVDRLKSRHAEVLVAQWRTQVTRRTAAERYTALEWWCTRALGKPGMVKPLDALWPPESDAVETSAPPRSRSLVSELSAAALERIHAIDVRGALLLQVRAAFGLTNAQAASLQPWLALSSPGLLVLTDASGRTVKTLPIDTPQRAATAAALEEWGAANRGTLGWPDMTATQLMNRLSHLGRVGRRAVETVEASDGAQDENA